LSKVKTSYIIAKCQNNKTAKICQNAEIAKTAETFIIKFLYNFGIVNYKI